MSKKHLKKKESQVNERALSFTAIERNKTAEEEEK